MACCKVMWCDFAVLSGGELFVERIPFDRIEWEIVAETLKLFYIEHYGPELVYPGFVSD